MRTRTHLTTPPGQEPVLSDASRSGDEVYVPGLALPSEPRVPGRRRRLWVSLTVILVVAAIAAVAFVVMTAGQTFDPALEPDVAPAEGDQGADPSAPADEPLPGEG